jgi:hypothetical protein
MSLQVIKAVQWNRLVSLCQSIHTSTTQGGSDVVGKHVPKASHSLGIRIVSSVYILIANLKRMVSSQSPYLQKVWDDCGLTQVCFNL